MCIRAVVSQMGHRLLHRLPVKHVQITCGHPTVHPHPPWHLLQHRHSDPLPPRDLFQRIRGVSVHWLYCGHLLRLHRGGVDRCLHPLRCRHIHFLVPGIRRLPFLQSWYLRPRHWRHRLRPLHRWKVCQWAGYRLRALRGRGLHQLLWQKRLPAVCRRAVQPPWQRPHDVLPVSRGEVFQHSGIGGLRLVHQRQRLHHQHGLDSMHRLLHDVQHRQADPGPVHSHVRHLLRCVHADFQLLLRPRRIVWQHHQSKLSLPPWI